MGRQGVRRVVIVGAGIGGPVLAMWLRRIGIDVVLAEARDAVALAEGAFLGVAPNGMNALAELGLAELVAAHGYGCESFQFTNRKGQSIGAIDRSRDREMFGWPLTMVLRSELHVLLADEAARRGIDVRYGKRLTAIDRSRENEVVARFADGSDATGDVLVGCDGLRSMTRSLAIADAPAPSFSGLLDYGGFAAPTNVPFPENVNVMVFGRRAFVGAFKTKDRGTWWFHNGPAANPDEPHERRTQAETRERLLELHREDPPWIADVIRATPQVLGAWPIYELREMPRWSDGRVCLLGDAAHAMSPSAGQGASLAMEDAMVLAQSLRDIDDPMLAFQTFEQLRRPRVDAIAAHARRSGSGKAVGNAFSEWCRDRLLPVFLRFGASAQTKSYAYRVDWAQPIEIAA